MKRTTDLLIIGGGPTGLGAAWQSEHEGNEYLLVDRNDMPGGASSSVTDDFGFVWDLGGHVIHSHFREFDEIILEAGTEMVHPMRAGYVWEPQGLVSTPIQHQLDFIPEDLRPHEPAHNLADFFSNHFGAELNKRFFQPFNERMWAHPLDLIDHAWTSLRSGSSKPNVPAPALRGTWPSGQETFPYPRFGTGRLWGDVAALINPDRLVASISVNSIDAARHKAFLSDGSTVCYSRMISTVPISDLLGLTRLPQLLVHSPRFLHSEVMVIGVGCLGQPPPMLNEVSWLYSASPETEWHRATMLSNYSPDLAGRERWSILFETGLSAYRPLEQEVVRRSCVAWLLSLGIEEDSLQSVWSRYLNFGYPVPFLGRDALLREIDDALLALGIRTRGRFGGWRYESSNQDFCFMQGVQAARAGASFDSVNEDVYWHPEIY